MQTTHSLAADNDSADELIRQFIEKSELAGFDWRAVAYELIAGGHIELDDFTLESIDESAGALNLARRSLYTLMDDGNLRFVRVGRRRMIPRGERIRLVRERLERGGQP